MTHSNSTAPGVSTWCAAYKEHDAFQNETYDTNSNDSMQPSGCTGGQTGSSKNDPRNYNRRDGLTLLPNVSIPCSPQVFPGGNARETFFTTSCIYVNVRPAGITQKADDKIGSGGTRRKGGKRRFIALPRRSIIYNSLHIPFHSLAISVKTDILPLTWLEKDISSSIDEAAPVTAVAG